MKEPKPPQASAEETEKLNQDRGRDVEQVRKDLAELAQKQKELQEKTDSGKAEDLIAKTEEAIKELEKLQGEQKEAEKALEQAKSKELRDAGEMAKKLNELIERQKDAQKGLEAHRSRGEAIDKALGEMEKAIEEQKKAAASTRQAAQAPDKADLARLQKEQKDASDRAWQLGNDLTLVALSGEVVSEYVPLLEDALGQGRLWVAAYCHDVYGYLPSARVLAQGGYETRGLYSGGIGLFTPEAEGVLVRSVTELARQVGRPGRLAGSK